MANRKYKSIYEDTIDFIYTATTKRLNDRMAYLGKKISDLTVDNSGTQYDLSMISKIFNNKKTNNNPYLIPPAYIDLLVQQLKYNSIGELLWGKDVNYANSILFILIKEVLYKHPKYKENLAQALLEDVQYVKYVAVNTYSWYYDKIETELSDNTNGKLDKIVDKMQKSAIERFCCLYGFDYILLDYLIKNKGLSKLDKCIDTFVDNILIPLLININSDINSFGRQAYNLLSGCAAQLKRFKEYYVSTTMDKEADASGYYDIIDIRDRLKEECYSYVNLLEDAQSEMHNNLNMDLPDKKNIYLEYMKIVEKTTTDSFGKTDFIDEIQKHIE
jgi:hypothetical protein